MSTSGQLLDFFKIQFAKCQQANVLIQHPRWFEQGCFYTWTTLLCFKSFLHFFFPLTHSQCFTVKNGPKCTPPRPLDVTAWSRFTTTKTTTKCVAGQLSAAGRWNASLIICADENISQMSDAHTKKQWRLWNCEWTKDGQRGGLWNKRYETILSITTSNLLPPVAWQHISRSLVPVVGSVVFSLQTNLPGVQMESNRDCPTSSWWASAWLICPTHHSVAVIVFTHAQRNRAKAEMPPCFGTKVPVDPGVKASWKTLWTFLHRGCLEQFSQSSTHSGHKVRPPLLWWINGIRNGSVFPQNNILSRTCYGLRNWLRFRFVF